MDIGATERERKQKYQELDEFKKVFKELFSGGTADLKLTNPDDILNKYKSEYIYFRTDHHWTQLAAKYVYERVC